MRVLELSYRAILHHREQSLSLKGEERKTSKCERDCECDVRAAMPRASSSVSVGRRHGHRHAPTFVLRFPTVFEEKRDCSQSSCNRPIFWPVLPVVGSLSGEIVSELTDEANWNQMRKCPGQRLHLKPHLQVIYTARSNTSLSLTNKSMVSRLSYDFPVQSSHKSKIVEDFWVFKFFRCSVEGKHLIRFQRDSSVLKSLWRSISRKLSQLGRCPRLTLSWRDFLITWNTIACLKCSYSSYHLKIMVKICPSTSLWPGTRKISEPCFSSISICSVYGVPFSTMDIL